MSHGSQGVSIDLRYSAGSPRGTSARDGCPCGRRPNARACASAIPVTPALPRRGGPCGRVRSVRWVEDERSRFLLRPIDRGLVARILVAVRRHRQVYGYHGRHRFIHRRIGCVSQVRPTISTFVASYLELNLNLVAQHIRRSIAVHRRRLHRDLSYRRPARCSVASIGSQSKRPSRSPWPSVVAASTPPRSRQAPRHHWRACTAFAAVALHAPSSPPWIPRTPLAARARASPSVDPAASAQPTC